MIWEAGAPILGTRPEAAPLCPPLPFQIRVAPPGTRPVGAVKTTPELMPLMPDWPPKPRSERPRTAAFHPSCRQTGVILSW